MLPVMPSNSKYRIRVSLVSSSSYFSQRLPSRYALAANVKADYEGVIRA